MREWVKGLNELIRSEGHICSDSFWTSQYCKTKNYEIHVYYGVLSKQYTANIREFSTGRYVTLKLYENEYDLLYNSIEEIKKDDGQEMMDELKSYCK